MRILEPVLIAILLISLTLVIVFWPKAVSVEVQDIQVGTSETNLADPRLPEHEVSTGLLASLFADPAPVVYTPPSPSAVEETPVVDNTPAPPRVVTDPGFLNVIGSANVSGKQIYYFKDEQQNVLLRLSVGESEKSWTFLEITEDFLVLEKAGQKYQLSR